MTEEQCPEWEEPRPGTIWNELLPEYEKFPNVSVPVRKIMRNIRECQELEPIFKKRWIIAIASIFEENNIKNIIFKDPLDLAMIESKCKEATNKLDEVINYATEHERNVSDINDVNAAVVKHFEKFMISLHTRRNLNS